MIKHAFYRDIYIRDNEEIIYASHKAKVDDGETIWVNDLERIVKFSIKKDDHTIIALRGLFENAD